MPWIIWRIPRGARIQESHSVVCDDFQEGGKFTIIDTGTGLHDDLKNNMRTHTSYLKVIFALYRFAAAALILSVQYLAVLMPGIHCISPLVYLFLNRWKLILKELPHDVNVAAIQPVVINWDGVLLYQKQKVMIINCRQWQQLLYICSKGQWQCIIVQKDQYMCGYLPPSTAQMSLPCFLTRL